MTQKTLAELAGISVDYLSKLETGKRTNLSATTLFKLAKALNTTTDSLLTRTDSNNAPESTLDAQEQLLIARLNKLSPDKRSNLINHFLEAV